MRPCERQRRSQQLKQQLVQAFGTDRKHKRDCTDAHAVTGCEVRHSRVTQARHKPHANHIHRRFDSIVSYLLVKCRLTLTLADGLFGYLGKALAIVVGRDLLPLLLP